LRPATKRQGRSVGNLGGTLRIIGRAQRIRERILTFNTGDFAPYEVTAVDPLSVISGKICYDPDHANFLGRLAPCDSGLG
jgi:hypothetical protein